MRVALLHIRENFTPAPPMGILYIGTVLRDKGYDVSIVDSFPGQEEFNLERIKKFRPRVIGFSVLTTGYQKASNFLRVLRGELPEAIYCWGGVHPSALPEKTLEDENLDFVVIGEGEMTMLEVCERIKENKALDGVEGVVFKRNGRAIRNEPRKFIENLDELPIADRRLLSSPDFFWYLSPPGIIRGKFYERITTFYTSRGCPFKCIFCCSHLTTGRKLRKRSVENVMTELKYLKNEFGVKGLYFNDDTFGLEKKWFEEFLAGLQMNRINIVWGCQTRADIASKEMYIKMKRAGCVQVDIGAESGSERVLKNLKKSITPREIEEAVRSAREAGLKTFVTFVLGCPGETYEDIRETERLARKISAITSFLILVPYPGCELFKMAKENKWFRGNELFFSEDWMNKQSEKPVMEINFNAEELLKIRSRLQNRYFIKNNIDIFFSFLLHPLYLFGIVVAITKHIKEALVSFSISIVGRKPSVFLETVYQKFNQELMKRHNELR